MPNSKRPRKPSRSLVHSSNSTPRGIILERFKRLKGRPARSLDLISEFFIHHYLSNKRYLL